MSIEQRPTSTDERIRRAATEWLRALLAPEAPEGVIDVTGRPATLALGPDSSPRSLPTGNPPAPARTTEDMAWHIALYERIIRMFRRGQPTAMSPATIRQVRDEQEIRRTRLELLKAIEAAPDSRWVRFREVFDLGDFEQDILLLLLLHGTNLGIADMCAMRTESDNGRPTFALSLYLARDPSWDSWPRDIQEDTPRLAAEPNWEALSPERPLRHWRIVEITQPAGQPLVSCPLRLDERVVNHLMGIDYLDDRISHFCEPLPFDGDLLARSQATSIKEAVDVIQSRVPTSRQLIVQIPGGDGPTRRLFASHIAAQLGIDLYRVSVDQLVHTSSTDDVIRLWNRERRFQNLALVIDAIDTPPESIGALARMVSALEGVVFIEVPEPIPAIETALILDVARPSAAEQRELWQELLGDDAAEWADRLAGQFRLNATEILEAYGVAGDEPNGEALWAHLRSRSRARLEGLAQRIVPETLLDDVQLPAEEKRMLEQIRDQTRHRATVYDRYGFRPRLARGLGITALFAGESGTGKTMAAESIANELQLDLYRIDLASVVSKYIGETEKNLKRVFDAAEESGAVLLFDEADAIFGKRSEVQDSHDRYANIEVSYLLQRMEAYEGLAILTTNMKSALDQAFLRRLRFIITFPFPALEQRRAIWKGIFPNVGVDSSFDGLKGLDALDLNALAKPALTGGQIRNIAVNAAFLAAADNGEITMPLLYQAARDELRKNGRPFVAPDFAGWLPKDEDTAELKEAI